MHPLLRRRRRHVTALEQQLAPGGLQQARHQVDEGALAGAIRSDDGMPLAATHGEVELVEDLQSAEGHPEIAGLEHGIGAHDSPSSDEYVGRSPEGMRAGLGAARRSAREDTRAPRRSARRPMRVGSIPLRKVATINTSSRPIQKYQ